MFPLRYLYLVCALAAMPWLFASARNGEQQPRRLKDVVVDGRQQRALHVLAYVREYSTLATYTDTVTLFREKMVDYMLPPSGKSKMPSWRLPRVIGSRSYYRFTNAQGLDSVSDRCAHHFSWADWLGIPPTAVLPDSLSKGLVGASYNFGRYGQCEAWQRQGSRLQVDADMLSGDAGRRWIPEASAFFRNDGVDFERFAMHLDFDLADSIAARPLDLQGYWCEIESRGRGRDMFRFAHSGQPVFVTTRAEVYILDKEFVTKKEAELWAAGRNDVEIYTPAGAGELPEATLRLIARVEGIDHDAVHLDTPIDQRLAHQKVKMNFGKAALQRIKQMFGLDMLAAERKYNKEWKSFRRRQAKKSEVQGGEKAD